MKKIKEFVLILGVLVQVSAHGQKDNGTIETHEIKIVKDYNVFIEEATRINLPLNYRPQFQDKSSAKKINYQLPDRIEEFKFQPSSLTPIPYKSKLSIFKNENYVKLGFGSLLNPLVEWSHQKLGAKDPLSLYLNHHSAWRSGDSMQRYAVSNFKLDYTKGIKSWKLQSIISAENKLYNFYGNINESAFQTNSSRLYTHGGLDLNLSREKLDSKTFSFYNTVGFKYGSEVLKWFGANQLNHDILINGAVQGVYRYSGNTQFSLQTGVASYNLNFSQNTKKLNINVYPSVLYKNKVLKVVGGLNFIHADANADADFYILPKINTDVQLVAGFFNLYTSWERNIEMNTLNTIINANPFGTFSNSVIPNSLVENRLAGIKGSIYDFNYNTFIHQRIVKNALLFANDPTNPRYLFSTVEKNLTINNLSVELSYLKLRHWDFSLKGDIFLYELDNLPIAYNLPGQKIAATAHYLPSTKWNIQAGAYLIGGVKSSINNTQVGSGTNLDLNLGAEYLFYKKFYIFANINNILNSNVIQNIGYASYGVNGQLGFRILY